MANSSPSDAVIELGKRLVAELELEGRDRDTLARWLAHDIARRIEAVERLEGTEGQAERDACTAAILRLWEHRAVFPRAARPFGSAESALKVLDSLDLKSGRNRYFSPPRSPKQKDGWLETATAIDEAARVLLRACSRFAIKEDGGRAFSFTKLAERANLDDTPDVKFVRVILASDGEEAPRELSARTRETERAALKTFAKTIKRVQAAIASEAEVEADAKLLDSPTL